jgi:NADH-quinone oxidoreductase subunit M
MTEFLAAHQISALIAVPFLTIAAVVFVRNLEWIRRVALAGTIVELILALVVWSRFDGTSQGMQFVERAVWMPTFNIEYAVGVDGISVLLVVLTALLSPLCVLCAWSAVDRHVKAFMSLVLLVEGAMVTVFAALDVFLFFMSWEITMIPMYFMIILWGGPERIAAGIKFVLYSLTGSLLLLVGILGLYVYGGRTFNWVALADAGYPPETQMWIFGALLLAFAIKLPMVPLHSWLPDAHSEAPTAGSVILAGVLLKMGGYGFLRFGLPILPEASAAFAPLISWFSIAAILYGGYLALAQADLKKLIAYSSISHMGFVTLGIFTFNSQGIQGAVLQMFSHGITTGALFLAVGQLYDRTHSRSIGDYGGLHEPMPRFAAFLCLFVVASFGLPGTANFVGEFLVLVGASYQSFARVLLAMAGIVLAAAYMLWMLQRVMLGQPPTRAISLLPDLSLRETAVLAPLAALVLGIGLFPAPLMRTMECTVTAIVEHTRTGGTVVQPDAMASGRTCPAAPSRVGRLGSTFEAVKAPGATAGRVAHRPARPWSHARIRSATNGKNGFDERRISVSVPTVSTARSPRGLSRPRGRSPSGTTIESVPYRGSSPGNGTAMCVSEKTSGGHLRSSSSTTGSGAPGSTMRVTASGVVASLLVTSTRR